MKRHLHLAGAIAALAMGTTASAQRYLTEVFSDAEIAITNDVTYGTNISFFDPQSNLASPNLLAEITSLQTAVSTSQPIPADYYDAGSSTALKVVDLKMDVYQPDQGVDSETARPVMVYIHTGNAMPPVYNGSPNGSRKDSTAVETCKRFARRGYVAVSMSYRPGWNPLSGDYDVRKGTLLNAIYRAIHDVRQCVRSLKADASTYGIDPEKVILFGEGTGGYIALAAATLDKGSELFIDRLIPDPLGAPNVGYVDTVQVGNVEGVFMGVNNGNLTLYRANGYSSAVHFCVNTGGALADTSWLEPGDAPMVSFHTVFDPLAPFTEGTVIVPTTGEEVIDVHGSNLFMQRVNEFGNNNSFASLPDGNIYTDRARSLYGTTQTHGSTNVTINSDVEGLFPFVRPQWPAPAQEEASPWQWWNPDSPAATATPPGAPAGVTTHMLSMLSNPDMSAEKGRTYLDTIHGYVHPRIVCALNLGPCGTVGIADRPATAQGVEVFPNPATDRVTFTSTNGAILSYEVFDLNGRLVRTAQANTTTVVMERQGLSPGAYSVQLRFNEGTVVRKLMLD